MQMDRSAPSRDKFLNKNLSLGTNALGTPVNHQRAATRTEALIIPSFKTAQPSFHPIKKQIIPTKIELSDGDDLPPPNNFKQSVISQNNDQSKIATSSTAISKRVSGITPNKKSEQSKLESFREIILQRKIKKPEEQPLQLKDFQIGIQIGAGAFAVVKRVIHKDSQYTLALKTYEKKHLTDKQAQDALHQEILVLSQIEHPNIMTLFEVIDTRQNVSLVMELC